MADRQYTFLIKGKLSGRTAAREKTSVRQLM